VDGTSIYAKRRGLSADAGGRCVDRRTDRLRCASDLEKCERVQVSFT
jgi:hypothetical protein